MMMYGEWSCVISDLNLFRQVSLFEQVGRKFGRWLDVADLEQTIVIPSVSLLLPFQFDANAL